MLPETAVVIYTKAHLVHFRLDLLVEALVTLLHLLLIFDHHGEAVERPRVELLSVTLHYLAQLLCLLHHVSP